MGRIAHLLTFAVGIIGLATLAHVEAANLKVSVYYESLCPDSRRFIINQLYPTIQTLGGVNNSYLEAELIPYGKATTNFTNGNFSFDCQHGDQECDGNLVHACAIQKLSPAESAAFVNCSMAVFNSPITDPQCAASLGLNYTVIQQCVDSWEAPVLLAANGIKTHDLRPTLYYVPWILINGVWTVEDLDLAQRDLLGLICERLERENINLPNECNAKLNAKKH